MTPREEITHALAKRLTNERGNVVRLKLGPGLSATEITEFGRQLPGQLPDEIKDLLTLAATLEIGDFEGIDFLGRNLFEYTEVFPCALPILPDGEGNFWVVDIRPDTGSWGPIFFACHDPAAIVFQATNLTEFLGQIIESFQPPYRKLLSYVKDECVYQLDDGPPSLIDRVEAQVSPDPVISNFAKGLGSTFKIADLRAARIGSGFNTSQPGCSTVVERCNAELIFAIEHRE